jgi:4-aminobutyrate aminotransferase/(S)-3-amino-2-methylpropionate transaminase
VVDVTAAPSTHDLIARYVSRGVKVWAPAAIVQGRGDLFEDEHGVMWRDWAGGLGALNLGHAHPRVVAAVQAQAARFLHTDFGILPYRSYPELARRLSGYAPGGGPRKTAFFNSGTEAVENAVKVARHATGRYALIAFDGAFHGRTYMALSLSSRVDPYKVGVGPFLPEVYRAPYPYAYRAGAADPEAHGNACLDVLRRMFLTHVPPASVAAVVVEPVQCEGGFVIPPPGWLRGLRRICDEHGMLLIVDEVQTGCARSGRFFAHEHAGVVADLLVVGGSLASGLPLSGVVGHAALMDRVPPGGLAGTFVGNPLSCGAALATLDVIEEDHLAERAVHIGDRLVSRLRESQAKYPWLGDVRALGAFVGFEIVADPDTRTPDPGRTRAILDQAMARRLLLIKAGVDDNVVRLAPPLVVTDADLEVGLRLLEDAFASADRRAAGSP